MQDNSCSCEVFILSWTQLKAERPRPHVDLGSLSQCKVSIPGQMRHITVDQPSLRSLKCSIQNVLHIKVSKHLSWAFKLIASLQSMLHFYSYRQLCYRNLANLVSLVKSLELFVIQTLTNQIP